MAIFNQKKEGFEGTTVIAEGVRVQGEFKGDGPMIIDGVVKGTISTGKVVAGKIKGNIVAQERLELMAGSRVDGDVVTSILVIAEGATLNGRCTMTPREVEMATEDEVPVPKQKGNSREPR